MVTALVLSGGTGTRMGVETPKQYIEVEKRPIIAYCLKTLFSHDGIDAVQIVADEMWRDTILSSMEQIRDDGREAAIPKKTISEKAAGAISKFKGFPGRAGTGRRLFCTVWKISENMPGMRIMC